MTSKTDSRNSALIVTVLYLLFGFLWILISDEMLLRVGFDPETLSHMQTRKGLLYVLLSGVLIYALVRYYLGQAVESAARLRISEERFSGLVDRLNEGVYRMSLPDGVYEYQSPAMPAVFGYPLESMLNGEVHISEVIHPDDRDYFKEKWAELLEGVVPPVYDYRILDAEGRVRFIHQSNSGVFDENGKIVAIEGCCSDVTAQKEAEQERRRMEDRIRQSQKLESLGLLAGGIAHDFNNLLLSMLGNAELALVELRDEQAVSTSVNEIRRAALRASELSNQMLAYSGHGRFVITVLDINELIGETGGLLKVNLPSGVQIVRDLAPGLPSVRADGTQIRQVIMNLITNAGEAYTDGTGRIRITTRILEGDEELPPADLTAGELDSGPHVCVEVSDAGCGMDETTLQRLFDPFFTTKPAGRGLGLAAVLGIVRGHGGAIQVDSRVGKGSTFRLLLPATPEQVRPVETPKRLVKERTGLTVLVVDDEETVRNTTRRMLENQGYAVLTADGGARALELYAEQGDAIDVVLLDLTMPEMSGEAVFRALRQIDANVPVILSSGWTAEDSAEGLQALGLSGFLQKPYSLVEMARVIEAALDH